MATIPAPIQPAALTLAVCLLLPALAIGSWAHADQLGNTPPDLPRVTIVATTPVGTSSIAVDQFPGDVQMIDHENLPPNANSLADALNQSMASVNINDTQGNPYMVDLNFRGFTASPVLGTPQGLSVFVDGMRENEPLGDVVSWDLMPLLAVADVTLIPDSNPVYGLNTLGGAISLNTKSGFHFSGTEMRLALGSFGRRTLALEHGVHGDQTALYLAASADEDNGWAADNPSRVRQLFGKLGYRAEKIDINLALMFADTQMYGNQTIPLSMLADAAQGYSHPDATASQSLALNLNGKLKPNRSSAIGSNIYYRRIDRDITNSNINSDVAASANDPTCAAASACPASNLAAHYTQDDYGGNWQWSDKDELLQKKQHLDLGINAEYARTHFYNSGQYAYVTGDGATLGVAPFLPQAVIQSVNRRVGIFATDTVSLTDRLSATASVRYDYASISLAGSACNDPNNLCDGLAALSATPGTNTRAAVSGEDGYRRWHPALGFAYQLNSSIDSFGGFSEGFRTPSAIELACADPNSPCNGLPNAFSSDPMLKGVVSRTLTLGLRNNAGSRLHWHAAAFRSNLSDDILFNQTNSAQGYFSNVGETRRQGLEFGLDGRRDRFNYGLSASWVVATFASAFTIANGANSSCIAANGFGNGCSGVMAQPGDKIPGIPALTMKLRLGDQLTARTHLGASILAQGPQYARGDENNQDINGQVPGFASAKLDLTHQVNQAADIFCGVDNLFDNRYANFGMLSVNLLTTGMATQFRSVAEPRTFYLGVHLKI